MHKVLAKEKAREHGILTPQYRFIEPGMDVEQAAHDVTRSFQQPVIVKPVRWGSSVGITIAGGYAPVKNAIESLLEDSGGVLVEELIRGTEATQGIVERLRGEALYALPPVEIIPPAESPFFSYEVKYDGSTMELVPGRFPRPVADELARASRIMHEALGLRHYSRSDFMVSPKGVYYLETNTLPGLTSESLLPKSLGAVGVSFPDFLSHLIDLALSGRKR
jgi:D-alanine-D-alanine ligase